MIHRTWLVLCVLAALATVGAWSCGDDSSDSDVPDVRDVADVADEGTSCPTGQTPCGGTCVNLQSSAAHCGECDHACDSDEVCQAGACVLDCPATGPYADCGGESCASLMSDPANCGACDNACASGEVCSCGACVSACHNLNAAADNCAVCGMPCEGTDVCCCGACMPSADCPATCEYVPIRDQEECGTGGAACVDVRTDLFNCGECGRACTTTQRCGDGVCTTDTCTGVEVYCLGRCVNLRVSNQNCGRCGNACDPETENCMEGHCVTL